MSKKINNIINVVFGLKNFIILCVLIAAVGFGCSGHRGNSGGNHGGGCSMQTTL